MPSWRGHRQDPVVPDSAACIDAPLPGPGTALCFSGLEFRGALESWEPLRPGRISRLTWLACRVPRGAFVKSDAAKTRSQKWPQVTNLREEESSCHPQSHISPQLCVSTATVSDRNVFSDPMKDTFAIDESRMPRASFTSSPPRFADC